MTKYKNSKYILVVLFSGLLGLSLSLSYLLTKNNFNYNFSIIKILLYWIVFSVLSFLVIKFFIYLLEKIKIKKNIFKNQSLFIICFLSVFLSGILFLIVHYPGVGFNDTLYIIQDPVVSSTQHPLIYNLLLSYTYRFFNLIFNSANISYFCTSICQLLICSLIITYIIIWFNETIKNKFSVILLIIYFSLFPIISNYNVALIKDSLFGIVFLLYIPLLYTLINTNGKELNNTTYLLKLGSLFIITVLLRNNGLYVVVFTIICLMIVFRKYYKKLGLILFTVIILSIVPGLFIKEESLFQEKVGIPLQQLAYSVKYNEQSISTKDKKYLNKLMSLDLMKEKYNPFNVDTIKWDPSFNRRYLNETKIEFIKVWFSISHKNFSNYIKSYLLATYNLWSIDKFNPLQSRFLNIDFGEIDKTKSRFKELQNTNILPNVINDKLIKYYEKTTVYFSNGILLFILLFINVFALLKKNKKILILSIPIIGVYLTLLISAPISYALRYMSSYLYSLPVLVLTTFCIKNK